MLHFPSIHHRNIINQHLNTQTDHYKIQKETLQKLSIFKVFQIWIFFTHFINFGLINNDIFP